MKTTKYRLLVDGRAFSLQAKGGVSQIWAKLMASQLWRQTLQLDLFVYPGYEKNIHLNDLLKSASTDYINLIVSPIPPSDNSNYASEQHALQRQAAITDGLRGTPVAVVNTYYGENVLPSCPRYMVVAHDFAHEELPELAEKPSTQEVRQRKRLAFASANLLVFISNSTKLKFYQHYALAAAVDSRVIYHGHDQNIPEGGHLDHRIIHIGSRGGYKNFGVVEQAMDRLMRKNPKVRFWVFGGEAKDAALSRLVAEFAERVVIKGQPTDEEIDAAMATASIFISASRYEGFGIPLLNALRFGTIPVVADIDVYRELAGRDGIYFDPLSVDSAVAALERGLSAQSSPVGYWRTWDDVAESYLAMLIKRG